MNIEQKFHDVVWELDSMINTPEQVELQQGYPLYALTPNGKQLIGLLNIKNITDIKTAELISDARSMLYEIQYLLNDLQTILAQHCNENLHSAPMLAPATEYAIEMVHKHDPNWEDPAGYAVIENEEISAKSYGQPCPPCDCEECRGVCEYDDDDDDDDDDGRIK